MCPTEPEPSGDVAECNPAELESRWRDRAQPGERDDPDRELRDGDVDCADERGVLFE